MATSTGSVATQRLCKGGDQPGEGKGECAEGRAWVCVYAGWLSRLQVQRHLLMSHLLSHKAWHSAPLVCKAATMLMSHPLSHRAQHGALPFCKAAAVLLSR